MNCGLCQVALVALPVLATCATAGLPGTLQKREANAGAGTGGALPVVVQGQAKALIVAPAEPALQQVAADLAALLQKASGVAIPVIGDELVVEADGRSVSPAYRARHLILLGNALNNRAIFPLYCRWLDAADGAYPGEDGYELRTVVNPYGNGGNALILGATTLAGAQAGLDALRGKVAAIQPGQDLVLPHLLDVRVGPALKPAFERARAEVTALPERRIGPVLTHNDLAEFANDALRYAWTGERAFAERAAGVLRELNRRFDGSYYHADIRTCDDYALEYAVRGWLVLQHAGVLSADELWETDRNLYHDFPLSAHGPGNVGSRHLASGSMAFFLALDGLLTYGNPDAPARDQLEAWREGVRAYFHGACRTYRGDVDQAQDFGALENVFRYAIHDGYWEYFTSGWAGRTIRQMLMNVDNSGSYSGLGGYGEAMPGSLNYPVAIGVPLAIAAFVERRSDLRWIRAHVPNLGQTHLGFQVLGVHGFELGPYVPEEPPQGELLGLTVLPLSEYHWRVGQASVSDGVGPVTTPLPRCVDKVMLRAGFGPQDQYLLLNGFQNTVMGCLDGNAIVRFCDRGDVLLFQSTQEEGHDTKNAVWVSNGRNDDPLEGCVEGGPQADLGGVCFSATTLPRYHGTDWERNLFWRRGGVLVVMDRLTIDQPGAYTLACTWRSPRYARLVTGGAWEARSERGTFTIRWPLPAGASETAEVSAGRDGETRCAPGAGLELVSARGNDRFSAEVPWVLRQWRRLTGQRGQVVDFQNVLYRRATDLPAEYDIRRLGDGAACLSGSENAFLTRGPQQLPGGIRVDAEFAWLGGTDCSAAGLRRLTLGQIGFWSSAPVDLAISTADAGPEGSVSAAAPAELTLTLPQLATVTLGDAVVEARDGTARLQVPAGRHGLRCHGGGGFFAELARALAAASRPEASPAPAAAVPAAAALPDPLRSVWIFDGLRSAGRREHNLTLSSRSGAAVADGAWQAGPETLLGDTFFHHSLCATTVKAWQSDPVEVRLDLPKAQTMVGLRLHTYYGAIDIERVRPDPGTPSFQVSGDDPASARPVQATATRRYQYLRGCYGSAYFSEVVDEFSGLRETARSVLITLRRAAGGDLRLGRVELLTEGPPDTTPLRAQALRWPGTGELHWALYTPERGQLYLLDASGKPLWGKDFSASITGIAWGDTAGDGGAALVVTAADGKVRLLDPAGEERLIKDWRGVYEETGGKYYYGPNPHGVAICRRPGQAQAELAIGHYYFLTRLGLDGTLLKTHEGTGCYWQDFLDAGVDLNGDGENEVLAYTETPWQTRVPVVVVDSRTGEPLSTFAAGNGGARLFEAITIGDERCVAVGSHKGCGIYSLTKGAYRWFLAGEVFRSSFFLTDLERDGTPDMLVGQRDGLLLAVDLAGRIARRIEVGEEVTAVGALGTGPGLRLLASGAAGTRSYDVEGKLVGWAPLVAQRFLPTADPGTILALHLDGRVELLGSR